MATRSIISIRLSDVYHSVRCHWDGYPAHNGMILDEFYRDPQQVEQLIQLGNMSSLGAGIGKPHDPCEQGECQITRGIRVASQCTFYDRDHGHDDDLTVSSYNFLQFLDHVRNSTAEFYYVMQDSVWYCGATYDYPGVQKNQLVPLSATLATLRAMEDV